MYLNENCTCPAAYLRQLYVMMRRDCDFLIICDPKLVKRQVDEGKQVSKYRN